METIKNQHGVEITSVDIDEANMSQLRQYCQFNMLEGWQQFKKIEQLRRFLNESGYRGRIQLVVLPDELHFDKKGTEDLEWDGKLDTERWCQMRIHPEVGFANHSNKLSPVYVNNGRDDAWLPRGRDFIVRERLFLALSQAQPTSRHQDQDKFGIAIGRFEDAVVARVDKYPHTFHRYRGLVKNGDPRRPHELDPNSSEFKPIVRPKGMGQHEAIDLTRKAAAA